MNKKVIYATVMYECNCFDTFINDYLRSVFEQTVQDFELLIIIDSADKSKIDNNIQKLNINNKTIHIKKYLEALSPIQLRKKLIDISYSLNADILIFSDFDENVASNRVEEIVNNMSNYDFTFNDFYIVDNKLKRLEANSFFHNRDIPAEVTDWHYIQSFNYVGFGSLAINLKSYDYQNLIFPDSIKALDWFIATVVLVNGGNGVKLINTYANYRQHENSFVGFDFNLDEVKLMQGIDVKLSHYDYFKVYKEDFHTLYDNMIELKKYIDENGTEEYIQKINSKFDTNNFCWWENIKTLKEVL